MNSAAKSETDADRTVLIVEDEFMLAFNLKGIVEKRGYTVIGPAASIRDALALIGQTPPAAALLDANVRDESVAPVAQALHDCGIPFAVVTGYGGGDLGSALVQNAPRVRKPFTESDIAAVLDELLGRAAQQWAEPESGDRLGSRHADIITETKSKITNQP